MSMSMDIDVAGGSQWRPEATIKTHEDGDDMDCIQPLPKWSILPAFSTSRLGNDSTMGDDSAASKSLQPDEELQKASAKTSSPIKPRGILRTPTPFFDILHLPLRGKRSTERAVGVSDSNAETKERASKEVSFAEGTMPGGVAAFGRPLGRNKAEWPPEILDEIDRGVEKWIQKSRETEARGTFLPSKREVRMMYGALRDAAWQKCILAKKASEKEGMHGSKMKGKRATRMKAKSAKLKAKTASKIEVQMTNTIEETKATRIGGRKEVRASEPTANDRSMIKWLGLSTGDEK